MCSHYFSRLSIMKFLTVCGVLFLSVTVNARVNDERRHRKLQLAGERWRRIPEQYLIRFADSVEDVEEKTKTLLEGIVGVKVLFVYHAIMEGVVLNHVPLQLLDRLLEDDEVMLVEEDQEVELDRAQGNPPWGLDRLDQKGFLLNRKYCFDNAGKGVDIYIVDTGIRSTHDDFSGRVTCGFNAIASEDCEDGNSHGTHVAGTAAGERFGVAKSANLITVKVLNTMGKGSLSNVAAGLNYIKEQKLLNPDRPSVANLSLGSGYSPIINSAVDSAVDAGVMVVVAAGNHGGNACNYSPASALASLAVGATSRGDFRAQFSNVGDCVDIFAPGVSIASASNLDDGDTATMSGTSMAAPHAAGVVALYLSDSPDMTPAEVTDAVLGDAIKGKVRMRGRASPSLLLHIGIDGDC